MQELFRKPEDYPDKLEDLLSHTDGVPKSHLELIGTVRIPTT